MLIQETQVALFFCQGKRQPERLPGALLLTLNIKRLGLQQGKVDNPVDLSRVRDLVNLKKSLYPA